MTLLALLLAAQAPYVAFPEPGLDDPAAYAGYTTRVYRDARANAVQIYIDAKSGRVVHVWADALDESIGFTTRDAAVGFGAGEATVGATGGRRWLRYDLTVQGGRSVRLGHFLLGSMRIERDFGYAGRVRDSLDAPPFVVPEMQRLAQRLGAQYRARLTPRVSLIRTTTTWTIHAIQSSLDGRNLMTLTLSGSARRSRAALANRVVTIRPLGGGTEPLDIHVEIATNGPALHPLGREAIFNSAFRRFADSAKSPRLEREIRGFELLSSREKLMAGLPNYATYFGRDMLMTAILMEPIWSDTMAEHVMAAALAKLNPAGEVSHEEALGGQAIRENAARYLQHPDQAILRNLQAVRENYFMVDDDFQLPVVAGRYFANPAVPDARKREFLARWREPLIRNLTYVLRQAAPYARDPVATNLVGFHRDDDGWWHPGSWRDSRVGYAGGRFAFDVNVVWVPAALRAIAAIDSTLRALGLEGVTGGADAAAAAQAWRGTSRHFEVALAPGEVESRVRMKLASLPAAERLYWEQVLIRAGLPADTLRFLAVSLDSAGQPIPVMSTDPAMWLLLEDLGVDREREVLRPFALPYPVGLFVDGLGPLAANDAYAPSAVWQMFENDLYHSPRVVWGREVNTLLVATARRGSATPLLDAVVHAVEQSGFRHAELWSYEISGGALRPIRYGTGSDVQLWSLTDLAVQYLLNARRLAP
ncbi:MAG TPA: hypothetical protein VGQ18_12535 [Gemmatimonadales bacterium]|nr:hypothetical protein [Gemmatimonadales bacterium]